MVGASSARRGCARKTSRRVSMQGGKTVMVVCQDGSTGPPREREGAASARPSLPGGGSGAHTRRLLRAAAARRMRLHAAGSQCQKEASHVGAQGAADGAVERIILRQAGAAHVEGGQHLRAHGQRAVKSQRAGGTADAAARRQGGSASANQATHARTSHVQAAPAPRAECTRRMSPPASLGCILHWQSAGSGGCRRSKGCERSVLDSISGHRG